MRILVAGANGMVGNALIESLLQKGFDVATLTRNKYTRVGVESFLWNPDRGELDSKAFDGVDILINLAGENVGAKRWTKKRKQQLRHSRIESSGLLYREWEKTGKKLQAYITASGVSYYGSVSRDKAFVEEDLPGSDFLAQLSVDWEEAADLFQTKAKRLIKMRMPMVLSNKGGAIVKLLGTMKFGPAVIMGNGAQYMPWIHIDDLVGAILFFIDNEQSKGVYNISADTCPTNAEFMRSLGRIMNRPALKIPAFAMKWILGEMHIMLLEGSPVSNHKLKSDGFHFHFNEIETALKHLFKSE